MIAHDAAGGALAMYALVRCLGAFLITVALAMVIEWANKVIQGKG